MFLNLCSKFFKFDVYMLNLLYYDATFFFIDDSDNSGGKSFQTSQPLSIKPLFKNGMLWNGSTWVDWLDDAMDSSFSESRQTPSKSTEKTGKVSRSSRSASKSSQSSSTSIETRRKETDYPSLVRVQLIITCFLDFVFS